MVRMRGAYGFGAPESILMRAVVVAERALEPVARLVLRMRGVHELPEHVVQAVRTHLDQHEVVPRLGGDQMASDAEAPLGHLEHALQREFERLVPEVGDVEDVLVAAERVVHLGPQLGRVRDLVRQELSAPRLDVPPAGVEFLVADLSELFHDLLTYASSLL